MADEMNSQAVLNELCNIDMPSGFRHCYAVCYSPNNIVCLPSLNLVFKTHFVFTKLLLSMDPRWFENRTRRPKARSGGT